MLNTTSRQCSISSSHCSSTKSSHSFWSKISQLFRSYHHSHHSSRSSRRSSYSSKYSSAFSRQTTGHYSNTTLSDMSVQTIDTNHSSSQKRSRKQLVNHVDNSVPQMIIPPFSPTYCKENEFPYSNFYVKLPDGRWMIRYRDGNRDILRTDIVEGYMI
ncbi:uncharacterized protein BX663DRAFT_505092 [Cokeromyces recurvatus]|uniref:uncharacterized protein n=1 Tax=Cokeromyces recurvatus TaxID=90255 RepID=UPI00221FED32|nr:uncharacterized protein BX663DRAFT_505092 [Cokeromyces recurvatus]KAI7904452.1 hypothetical protein BX663DRAFT_505092 [Cokeromyces recurvatus]